MIRGVHAMFYTPKPDEARTFLRDTLGLPFVETHEGWFIFGASEVEVGCHPADAPRHDISFYCDDVEATVEELKAKGVTFNSPIEEEDWGRVTSFTIPGGVKVLLYEPKYVGPAARR